MFEPSTDWTPEERVKVATEIAGDLVYQIYKGGKGTVLSQAVMDYGDRIIRVLQLPVQFLETNREHVLKGQFTQL